MKIDKYAEILGEWNSSSGIPMNIKNIFALDETIKDSELNEDLIVYIQVKDTEDKPVLAEVRCYPIVDNIWYGDLDGTNRRIEEVYQNGNLEFIRTMTDETGYAVLFLQPGDYQIEVSKGSAYSVEAKRFCLESSQTILKYTLKPLRSRRKKAGMQETCIIIACSAASFTAEQTR